MTIGYIRAASKRFAESDGLPMAYADPIQAQREAPKPRVRVKAGSSK